MTRNFYENINILNFILNKWENALGAINLKIHHRFCNSKEIYYYCKICYKEYILERNGSYPEQYILLKSKKQPITCDCGKIITKSYYYNNHLKTKYHNTHIKTVLT